MQRLSPPLVEMTTKWSITTRLRTAHGAMTTTAATTSAAVPASTRRQPMRAIAHAADIAGTTRSTWGSGHRRGREPHQTRDHGAPARLAEVAQREHGGQEDGEPGEEQRLGQQGGGVEDEVGPQRDDQTRSQTDRPDGVGAGRPRSSCRSQQATHLAPGDDAGTCGDPTEQRLDETGDERQVLAEADPVQQPLQAAQEQRVAGRVVGGGLAQQRGVPVAGGDRPGERRVDGGVEQAGRRPTPDHRDPCTHQDRHDGHHAHIAPCRLCTWGLLHCRQTLPGWRRDLSRARRWTASRSRRADRSRRRHARHPTA